MFLDAMRIRREILGEKHPDYASSLDNLGGFYSAIGSYQKAEPLYLDIEN
ncbi:MAG: tetratricopeptide repeat protein [Ignavibacteria bacterium]|nr:tetratricopeptide repeat protein [Ignavibacteria bacterium]